MTLQERFLNIIRNNGTPTRRFSAMHDGGFNFDPPQLNEASVDCEKMATEEMGGFAEWTQKNKWCYYAGLNHWDDGDGNNKSTTLELIEMYFNREK